jgi:hypothetical protein
MNYKRKYKNKPLVWKNLTPRQRQEIAFARIRNLEMGDYNHSRAPFGYKYVKDKKGYRNLVHDEPVASALKTVYDAIVGGDFSSFAEVKVFLNSRLGLTLTNGRVRKIVIDPRNIGWFFLPESLGKKLIKGNFPPIIEKYLFEDALRRILEEGW